MKAIVITRHGDSSVLQLQERPLPEPRASEVRIAVKAAGLNFAEVMARQGLYPDAPKPPCVVGYEVAGTIDAVGAGVAELTKGDRVWGLTHFGGHAEYVCTNATAVRRLPDVVPFEKAAAVPVVYATASLLVSGFGRVQEGERVLIHMAAGGVGIAALQLLRRIPGVTLFGTASASKHAHLRDHGLDHAIDYRTVDYEAEVRRLTDGRGVDVVLDALGGPHWAKNYRLLAPLGRLMVYGFANATQPGARSLIRAATQLLRAPRWSAMTLMGDNKAVMGLNLGHLFGETQVIKRGLDEIEQLLASGAITPTIDQVFPFSRVAEAHRRIEGRQNIGKVVLVPD